MSSKDKNKKEKKEKNKKEEQPEEIVRTIVSVKDDEPASSPVPAKKTGSEKGDKPTSSSVPVKKTVSVSNNEIAQLQKDIQDLNDAVTALYRVPIFFSQQSLFSLGSIPPEPPYTKQQQFIIRMFKEIKNTLLFPKTLPSTEQNSGTAFDQIRKMVNTNFGYAAALVKPAQPTDKQEPYSPFLQIEPAMAFQQGLPILLVIENSMLDRAGGVWSGQLGPVKPIVWFSDAADSIEQFFNSVQWTEALQAWSRKVRSGFLGS